MQEVNGYKRIQKDGKATQRAERELTGRRGEVAGAAGDGAALAAATELSAARNQTAKTRKPKRVCVCICVCICVCVFVVRPLCFQRKVKKIKRNTKGGEALPGRTAAGGGVRQQRVVDWRAHGAADVVPGLRHSS